MSVADARSEDPRGRVGRLVLPDSGPAVARLFHAALALVFVVAFASLARQLGPLFGADGLAPIADALAQARAAGQGPFAVPTIFWLFDGDGALHTTAVVGAGLGVLALVGLWPRVCIGLATLLYLSFTAVGAPFLGFQWDSLLIECGVLALLLPRDRPSPAAHALLLFAWFKLYFESGLAKWHSPLGDWQDGSAMTHYYETAPLPGPLAWYAHHLPAGWHAFEGWATLFAELPVPLLVFCGRPGRLVALVVLTLFQLINLATANYGFFVYLALALHLFLLRDGDLLRLYARLPGRRVWGRVLDPPEPVAAPGRLRHALLHAFAALYLALSLADARVRLGGDREGLAAAFQPYFAQLRVFNTYHLFAAITTERIEPEFAGFDGAAWRTYDLPYKPGPLARRPPIVAPHQPRLDFQLWFHGLRADRLPLYVRRLLDRLCRDPARVQPLFAAPLLPAPRQVRIRYWRYTFTAPGAPGWWQRTPSAPDRLLTCPPQPAPKD
jgi:hypothetical protein